MRKSILSTLLLVTISFAYSQSSSSDKAKNFLEKVYENLKNQKAITIKFTHTLENLTEDIHQENKGSVDIEGEKYRLEYLGISKISDGKMLYTIVPDNEEVTIESINDENENNITPSKAFDFYREGYIYKWDILQPVLGKKIRYIELKPIKTDAEVKRVLIGADEKSYQIYTIIQIGRNDTKTVISIDEYTVKKALPEDTFLFDRAYYEDKLGYYINEA